MLEILKYPDPRLKEVSQPVAAFDLELHRLLDQMAAVMYSANGVGLAAPQVGRFLRAFVIDITPQDEPQKQLHEFVNPVLSGGEGQIIFEEGCLSVPGIAEEVKRKRSITVRYHDRHGKPHTMTAEELMAVAIQHENDHLDGILFIDRLSLIRRRLIKRKLTKVVTL
jgi:peptide deformylase